MTEPQGSENRAAPFDLTADVDWPAVRKAFDHAEYTLDMLSEFAGVSREQSTWSMALAVRRSAPKPGLNTLARLFLFGMAVPLDEIEKVLGRNVTRQLTAVGVLHPPRQGLVLAECTLLPYQEHLIVHDVSSLYRDELVTADHVVPIADTTMLLAYITPRFKIGSAVDIGTGSGFQALLASQDADTVVATDVSDRALAFAGLCLHMNQVTNIDLRKGSFFDPVGHDRFDLIVSNPPFVISPDTNFVYRDCEEGGNALCETMIRQTARHLNDGGFGVMLLNWTHEDPQDWADVLPRWAREEGCDLLQLRFTTHPPLDYAANWLCELSQHDLAKAESELDRWLAYYRREDIQALTFGGVILRRKPHGRNWMRSHLTKNDWMSGRRGEQILRMFANVDLLEGLNKEEDLLSRPFVLAPEHLLSYALEAERGEGGLGGGWKNKNTKLHLTHGFEFTANTDPNFATVLAACDGRRSFLEAIRDTAMKIGQPVEDLIPGCLGAIRPLLEGGFVLENSEEA